jgi:hypothetical protein
MAYLLWKLCDYAVYFIGQKYVRSVSYSHTPKCCIYWMLYLQSDNVNMNIILTNDEEWDKWLTVYH